MATSRYDVLCESPQTTNIVISAPLWGVRLKPPEAIAATRVITSRGTPDCCAHASHCCPIRSKAMEIPPEADPVRPANTFEAMAIDQSGVPPILIPISPSSIPLKPSLVAIRLPKPTKMAVFIMAKRAPFAPAFNDFKTPARPLLKYFQPSPRTNKDPINSATMVAQELDTFFTALAINGNFIAW